MDAEQRQAIETACRNYIKTIWQMDNGELSAFTGDAVRREYHEQLLELTGLSAFEFGGLPAWYDIDGVEKVAKQLFNALLEQMESRNVRRLSL